MNASKGRTFRPRIESMESRCLLSAGLAGPPGAVVHQDAVVNLAPTPVGADVLTAIRKTAPHSGHPKFALRNLTADSAAGTVTGAVVGVYGEPIIGSITVIIRFTTSLSAPRPGDVKISLSKFNSFLSSKTRLKVEKAVVSLLQRDHDQIVAQFPQS